MTKIVGKVFYSTTISQQILYTTHNIFVTQVYFVFVIVWISITIAAEQCPDVRRQQTTTKIDRKNDSLAKSKQKRRCTFKKMLEQSELQNFSQRMSN